MDPRLKELLERLSAPGSPGKSLSASEFAEVVDYCWDLQERVDTLRSVVLDIMNEPVSAVLLIKFIAQNAYRNTNREDETTPTPAR
jgi:hypothetical protein